MRVLVLVLVLLAAALVALGVYAISTGSSPDVALGGALPIILGAIVGLVAAVLALIDFLRRH